VNSKEALVRTVSDRIAESLPLLPRHLRAWAERHLITPRAIQLFVGLASDVRREFWLVTDHTGADDSSYRVIYDAEENLFGLAVTLDDGRACLLGLHRSFAESVDAM